MVRPMVIDKKSDLPRVLMPAHKVFETKDLDHAREEVSRYISPYKLSLIGNTESLLDVQYTRASFADLTMNYLRYGSPVEANPGEPEVLFLLQFPLRGSVSVKIGTQEILSTPSLGSVFSPTLPGRFSVEENVAQLMMKIPRRAMESHLAALLDQQLAEPLEFNAGMDFSQRPQGQLRNLINLIVADIEAGSNFLSSSLIAQETRNLILTSMLKLQPSNYSNRLAEPVSPAAPRSVRVAEEYMRSHADHAISIVDLAKIAGVSPRALQIGFRRFRNRTPLEFLRQIRLDRINKELRTDSGNRTIAEIARRWGVTHLGNFSREYTARFNEKPSQTLRRRK